MAKSLNQFANRAFRAGVIALAASTAACASGPQYAGGLNGGYPSAPQQQPAYSQQQAPAVANPSPFTGRVVDRGRIVDYCENVGGREMWVRGYSERVVGADGQIYQQMHTVQYNPNHPTWSCSTLGQLNRVLPSATARVPGAPYNNVPTTGPRGYNY